MTAVMSKFLGIVILITQLVVADRAAIEAYKSAIRSAESGTSPGAIERAYSALRSMREALMRLRNGRDTVLEAMSDEEFTRLQRELPGVRINREEAVFIKPDTDYYSRLAGARGDAADRAFFAALKLTYPESVWPSYIEQQTDYSGCTRFGTMSLVQSYRAWSEFQRTYPDRYAAAASEEAASVLDQLTQSTCACGDAPSVEREFQEFLRTFPTSPARTKVEQRLQALRNGHSDIRTRCKSG